MRRRIQAALWVKTTPSLGTMSTMGDGPGIQPWGTPRSPTVIRYFCVMYQVALGGRLADLRNRGRGRPLGQCVAVALQATSRSALWSSSRHRLLDFSSNLILWIPTETST